MYKRQVVQEINTEYDTKLQDEKNSVSYDVLEMRDVYKRQSDECVCADEIRQAKKRKERSS